MKNCKSILCVVLGFALVCAVAATAGDRPKLTFTFTKANVPGAMQTGPSGINNAGVMVGGYVDKNSVSHGYIRPQRVRPSPATLSTTRSGCRLSAPQARRAGRRG